MREVKGCPGFPGESANQAWELADDVLRTQRDYCAAPTEKEDIGRHFADLLERIDQALDALAKVRSLMTTGWEAAPAEELLAAVEEGLDVASLVQARTYIKYVDNTESDILDARAALSAARTS
mgnify:CR=1 FL=1